jgi:hypothetical protein
MAALALGTVGAGVGSMFGFASIGWSIGSALGNYFFAPDQPDIEGPRLTDRRVSGSAYGVMRPKLYGTYRMAGEIIWSDEIKERKHKEEQGKGGGGGDYITYTYDVSFAMALCEGECDGIRKIWMDSKLVYTAADDSSIGELIASEKLAKKIKFYSGSETQLPDSVIESVMGSGNVPAYRGTCYLLFERLEITQFGNRIPQVTVEVVKNGSNSVTDNVPSDVSVGISMCSIGFVNGTVTHYNQTFSEETESGRLEARQYVYDVNDLSSSLELRVASALQNEDSTRRSISVSPNYKIAVFQDSSVGGLSANIGVHYYDELVGGWFVAPSVKSLTTENLDNLINVFGSYGHLIKWESDYTLYFYKSNSGDLYKYEAVPSVSEGSIGYFTEILWSEKVASDATDSDLGSAYAITIDRMSRDVFVSMDELGVNKIKRYSSDGDLLETKTADGSTFNVVSNGALAFSNGLLWQLYSTTKAHLKITDWDSEEVIYDGDLSTSVLGWTTHQPIMEVAGNTAFMFLEDAMLYTASLSFTGENEGLDDVVMDICTTVGIDPSDIDATDLATDSVRGYLISGQTPARGALEQLSAAYFFDGRESDGVLEFIKRGDYTAASLDDDDLGCYEGGDVQELADAVRIQEEELPKALTLVYANVNADYQAGAQYSIRQSVLNGIESTINLPIAFTDDEGKSIVDKIMYSAWENRHKFTLKTWQSFCKLDPADVISARGETLRIISRNEGVNGIIEIEAVRELPQIYTGQIGAGSSGSSGGQTIEIGGPTKLYLLDTPPLRDMDYQSYGLYAAANGYLSDWPGYTLLKSNDFGDTYMSAQTGENGAAIGQAMTALGDFDCGNIFDETNIVRVSVIGTLETKTEAQVLDGGNIAALGDELIQFKVATLVSTGIYDLSGLLRGRIGTEWAIDSHTANERFALLTSDSTRFAPVQYTDMNVLRRWGAITFGDTLEEITTSDILYTGNNLKPLSPVGIVGGVIGFNTAWTINWVRRSRYFWQWVDLYDVGEDEPTESYEVRIMNGADVVRTLTSSTEAVTYTYAQQVTDFGSFQLNLDVQVRMVGQFRNSEWQEATLSSGFLTTSRVLLHCNGTNGSTVLTDEYGATWTLSGNAQLSTTTPKFGSACLLLDGNGDYATSSTISFLRNLTSADFTIELFARREGAGTGDRTIFDMRAGTDSANFDCNLRWNASGVLQFYSNANGGGSAILTYTWAFTTATWYHIAVTRNGSAWNIWIDGVSVNNATNSGTFNNGTAPAVRIGADSFGSASDFLHARVDEVRIKAGQCIYTETFTPPTAEFTD